MIAAARSALAGRGLLGPQSAGSLLPQTVPGDPRPLPRSIGSPAIRRAEPTFGNLFVLGAGELAARGLTFLAFAYLGRVLEPAHFGLLGSAYAVMMISTLAIDQGFGVVGSRAIARDLQVTEGLVTRIVAAQLDLAIILFLLLFAGTWVLSPEAGLAGLLRGLAFSLLGVPFLLNWVFQGRNEMFWYAAPAALRQALFLAGAVLLVRGPDDLLRLPIAELGAVAGAGTCFVMAYRGLGYRLRLDLRGWDQQLFRQALPIGISTLIWAARMYVPVLVVLAALGPGPAGLFESAHRLIMALLVLLNVYFTNVFPAMSATSQAPEGGFERLLRRALRTSLGGTAAICVITFLLAPQVLGIVFGASYVTPDSVRALIVLVCLTPVLAWRRTGRLALIVLERQRAELWCSTLGVALLLALLWPLARFAGIVGAAGAMLTSELFGAAITWMVLRAHLRRTKEATGVA